MDHTLLLLEERSPDNCKTRQRMVSLVRSIGQVSCVESWISLFVCNVIFLCFVGECSFMYDER